METPVVYAIRVAGRLGATWTDWYDGLEVIVEPSGETVLRGRLPDQAALIGLLTRLHALNLTLIAFERVVNHEFNE